MEENESGIIKVDVLIFNNLVYSVFVGTNVLIHEKN